MPRRIIGQCSIKDFKDLQHLSSSIRRGNLVDMGSLSNTQKAAVQVLRHLQSCSVPFKVALKLREVLIWEMRDESLAFEYKLLDPRDLETQKILWAMTPTKVG